MNTTMAVATRRTVVGRCLLAALFAAMALGGMIRGAAAGGTADSYTAYAGEVLEFGELQAVPAQPVSKMQRSIRNMYEGSTWTLYADGSLLIVPGPNANVWYDGLVGSWSLESNDTIVFSAQAISRTGNTGSNEVFVQGVIGALDNGQEAAYIIHQSGATSAAVVNNTGFGSSTSRTYEFLLALY